jgi:phosphatidylserine/phosphatidylglycerophosphate/cardiolipin synthase-like enzyme
MNSSIQLRTLTDGGQQAAEIARVVADFIAAAKTSLDLAQYDFNLGPETRKLVGGTIQEAARRGVAVRILYNVDHPDPMPVPPPAEPDVELITALAVPSRGIAGVPDLMHHKYVVRDGTTVWTGSLNWTDDSWSRQENVVLTAESPELARAFTMDFDELWETGSVERSGFVEPRPVEVGGIRVKPWFTPGFGEALSSRIAKKIAPAQRIRICSPVITAAPVLATLAQVISDGRADVAGCVDATQVDDVVHQWHENGNVAWKLPLLQRIIDGPFSGKRSEPWELGSVHNFMHAKVVVADDVVFAGSFNLSHSGEKNAENVLEVRDAELAERLCDYVDEVRARYPALNAGATPTRSSKAAST